MTLNGMTAIVTGAGRGIGESIARALAENQAKVAVVDIDARLAEITTSRLKAEGFEAIGLRADITKEDDIKNVVDFILDKYGKIDILVNNAGVSGESKFENLTIEEWDRVINVNLKGTFLCSQAVIRHMKDQSYGRIINISSMAGIMGSENVGAHYCASKAGIIGLTKYLSRNYAYFGITVNAIAPGPIGSEMTVGFGSERYQKLIESMPMRRLGRAKNIGDIAAFLASRESEFVTGSTIEASGGEIVVI